MLTSAFFCVDDLVDDLDETLTPLGKWVAAHLIKEGWRHGDYGVCDETAVSIEIGNGSFEVNIEKGLLHADHFELIESSILVYLDRVKKVTLPAPPTTPCTAEEAIEYADAVIAAARSESRVSVLEFFHAIMNSAYGYVEGHVEEFQDEHFASMEHLCAALCAYTDYFCGAIPPLEDWGGKIAPLADNIYEGSLTDYAWERLELIAGSSFDELRPFLDVDAMLDCINDEGGGGIDCHGDFYYLP
jgi:hypothetical protein